MDGRKPERRHEALYHAPTSTAWLAVRGDHFCFLPLTKPGYRHKDKVIALSHDAFLKAHPLYRLNGEGSL